MCVCFFVFQSSELKREKGYSCLIQDVCAQNNRNTKRYRDGKSSRSQRMKTKIKTNGQQKINENPLKLVIPVGLQKLQSFDTDV